MATVISQIVPLELLAANESGIVAAVDGQQGFVVRLNEMGIHAGTRIRMIRPGSPCLLEINHQRLSIRLEDSASILVDVAR